MAKDTPKIDYHKVWGSLLCAASDFYICHNIQDMDASGLDGDVYLSDGLDWIESALAGMGLYVTNVSPAAGKREGHTTAALRVIDGGKLNGESHKEQKP